MLQREPSRFRIGFGTLQVCMCSWLGSLHRTQGSGRQAAGRHATRPPPWLFSRDARTRPHGIGVDQGHQCCCLCPAATTKVTSELAGSKRVQPAMWLEKKESRLDPGNVPLHLHSPFLLLRAGVSRRGQSKVPGSRGTPTFSRSSMSFEHHFLKIPVLRSRSTAGRHVL